MRRVCASIPVPPSRSNDPLPASIVSARLIVRVAARAIFPNCPRHIPKLQLVDPSVYVPKPGCDPVEPAWKGFGAFKGYVHPRQKTARGNETSGEGG